MPKKNGLLLLKRIILNPIKQYACQGIYQLGSKKYHHFIRFSINQNKHDNPSNKPSNLVLIGPMRH
ncbi:hypothetical protein SynMITS9220_02409 [Synechococcus sp. MIT S9220]|nr:hypothetical protein SynMITS9220_02409 [Synechococcus sp. MIT S9220]